MPRLPDPYPRRLLPIVLALAASVGSACATVAGPSPLPPRPDLPGVDFVTPCDPSAVVGLTQQGVENLKQRDAAWRNYMQRLEAYIRATAP